MSASNDISAVPPAATATTTSSLTSPSRTTNNDSASNSYRYERVSKESDEEDEGDNGGRGLATAAQRYRALRLAALRLSPESYSSTLAQEAAYPDEYWTTRLARRGFETFVCVAGRSTTAGGGGEEAEDGAREEDAEYVAQVTFRGPCEYGPWELPEDSGQPVQGPEEWEREERWQFTGLYVHDEHRGRGLAAGIVSAAMEWVRTRAREGDGEAGVSGGEQGQKQPQQPPTLQRVRFRTMIAPDNVASVALFRKLGYQDAGLCTMKEGVEANGEVLPEDWAEERAKWCTRGGWTMAKVVEL